MPSSRRDSTGGKRILGERGVQSEISGQNEVSPRARPARIKKQRGTGIVSGRSPRRICVYLSGEFPPKLPRGCSSRAPRLLQIGARRNRNKRILMLFIVCFGNAENELVSVDPEFRCFPDRKNDWMLGILWPDPVNDSIRLQDIFLAKQFLSVLVFPIRSENFTRQGFAAFFSQATGRGFHLQQGTLFIDFFFWVRGNYEYEKPCNQHGSLHHEFSYTFHLSSARRNITTGRFCRFFDLCRKASVY